MMFMRRFARASLMGLRNYFNFRGKTSKEDFWFFFLFFVVAYLLVWAIDQIFLLPVVNIRELPFGDLVPASYVDQRVGFLVLAFRPVMAIPTMAATVRRLRDVGRSGWWSLLWIFPLPVLGWFWLIPWLMKDSADQQKNLSR